MPIGNMENVGFYLRQGRGLYTVDEAEPLELLMKKVEIILVRKVMLWVCNSG